MVDVRRCENPIAKADDPSHALARASAAGFAFVTSGGPWQPAPHSEILHRMFSSRNHSTPIQERRRVLQPARNSRAAAFTTIPVAVYGGMTRAINGTDLRAADIQPVIDAAAKYHIIANGFPADELLK